MNQKVAIIGAGFVGSTLAYSLLQQTKLKLKEIILIDVNSNKLQGEVMDLSHSIPFLSSSIIIKSGEYNDCKDCDIVVITAGISSITPIQDRLELTLSNANIIREITNNVILSGFNGIFVIASNPVDVMTYVVKKVSQFPASKVIGTGTLLDTSRLKMILSDFFKVSPNHIQAMVLGEHGNSCFIPWSQCYIENVSMLTLLQNNQCHLSDLEHIYQKVKQAGFEIAEKKKATYYGIGMTLTKIITSIYQDESCTLPVSCYLDNLLSMQDICIGLPATLSEQGIKHINIPTLLPEEKKLLLNSYQVLNTIKQEKILPIL